MTDSKISTQPAINALSGAYGPGIPINTVDLGLIYKEDIDSDDKFKKE
ncbi:MAG: hypothetical protein K9H14_02900 [Actinomycetia bacterium]|nr:hypothetical protein [Actinomycetes bacterium]